MQIAIGHHRADQRMAPVETGVKQTNGGCIGSSRLKPANQIIDPFLLLDGRHGSEEIGRGLGEAKLRDGAEQLDRLGEIPALAVHQDDGAVDEGDRLLADGQSELACVLAQASEVIDLAGSPQPDLPGDILVQCREWLLLIGP